MSRNFRVLLVSNLSVLNFLLFCCVSGVIGGIFSLHADSDERWTGVDETTRTRMGVTSLADGEFWMEFKDFCEQFEEASVCTLGPDYDKDGKVDHVGQVRSAEVNRGHR